MAFLLAGPVTTNASSAVVTIPRARRRESIQRLASVSITGTITAAIEGRVHPDAPWYVISTTGVTTNALVTLPSQVRLTTSGVAGGSVSVWLDVELEG